MDAHEPLREALERLLPTLAEREQPFLLEVLVEADERFEP